ncbi:MAG: arylsulfatase [Phycisphaerales bacterium]|nr:arylsulfatase [Phycisphaerales bacterium]
MMTHRRLLLSMLVVAIGAGLLRAQPADRPPNVVFIMADDLGYREVGCFGQEKILTPNIDRLAAEGMRLTRHYAGSAVCAPTRAVLMTGKHTGHSPIRGNKESGGWGPEEPEGQHPLPGPEVTLAEMFRDRGYATGAFGKWGLGGPGSEGHPAFQGFDHFYGYLCQRVAHNYYPTHLWRNHDVDVLHNNRYFSAHQKLAEPLESDAAYAARFAGGDYAPEEIITELLGWVRGQHEQKPDQPFFVYYPTIIPHLALQAPQEWVDRYPRDWDAGPYLGDKGYLPNPRPRAAYAAMISSMDHDVGRILDLLDELGLAENTIVVFTSDNGASYVGGVDREFFSSHGELRGHKGQLWEGGIRVPTVVRWPGVVGPGTQCAGPSYHPDWMPTLAAAAGGAAPEGADGVSLLPLLRGEVGRVDREFLYWEFPEGAQQQALMFGESGRWKLLRPALRNEPARVELYDLLEDPGETTNLAETHPDLVAQALEIMRSQHQHSALFPIAALDR